MTPILGEKYNKAIEVKIYDKITVVAQAQYRSQLLLRFGFLRIDHFFIPFLSNLANLFIYIATVPMPHWKEEKKQDCVPYF